MCDACFVRTAILIASVVAFSLSSCRASVKANVNASSKEDTETEEPDSTALEDIAPTVLQTEYFGIARRLTLAQNRNQPACSCVAAAVGGANDPAFDWHGEKPDIGPDALIVAIGSEGIECAHKGRGASIAAIDRRGNDVVIVLEEFKDTRPMAQGAIIPNPGADGTVYLRARGKAPYGRPVGEAFGNARDLCKIGVGTQTASLAPPDQP